MFTESLKKNSHVNKSMVWFCLWGCLNILCIATIVVSILLISENISHWYQEKNRLEHRFTLAKNKQVQAQNLVSMENLKKSYTKIYKIFDRKVLESWLQEYANHHHCELSLLSQKEPLPSFFKTSDGVAEEHTGYPLTLHVQTFFDHTLFMLMNKLLEEAPFYINIQSYALKRLQPLTNGVLMNIKQGQKSYFFEGKVEFLVVASSPR